MNFFYALAEHERHAIEQSMAEGLIFVLAFVGDRVAKKVKMQKVACYLITMSARVPGNFFLMALRLRVNRGTSVLA